MNHMEEACESIDASVFSSDMLFDDERRNVLKDYIGRWTRAIEEHETIIDGSQSDVAAAFGNICGRPGA